MVSFTNVFRPWTLFGAALSLAAAGQGAAQAPPRCFGGEEVRSVPVTLGTRLHLDEACEYGLSADGPFRSLRGREHVVEVLEGLGWEPGETTTVYGRRRDTPQALASIFVDHCSDYLLAPGGAFRVTPGSERGSLEVARVSPRCGASALELRFECPVSRGGPAPVRLTVARGTQALPVCTAGWRVDVAPPGGRPYPLGRLQAGGETPLQSYFAEEAPRPLLRPDWAGPMGLRFAPEDDSALWEELRAAFAAGAARLVRKAGVSSRAACAGEGEPVDVSVGAEGLRIDPRYLAREMDRRYGDDADRFAPSLAHMKSLAGELHVCLAASYGVRQVGGALHGLPLQQLADVTAMDERFRGAEVCIDHRTMRVTPDGLLSSEGERQCAPAIETPLLAAVAGSVLEVPEGAIACVGREPLQSEGHRYVLPRGFVDVRVQTHGGCRTLEAASLARVGVVDPGRDWIPTGIRRVGRGGVGHPELAAWRGVRRDDPATFAWVRRRDTVRFRLTTPEGFATAWNHPARGAATAVSQFAPVIGDEEGDFGHARPPAFVTRVTASVQCPLDDDTADVVRVEGAHIDQVVHVHLILDDGRRQRCLATAAFRAWEPRVVASLGRSERRQLRFGVLGDARLGVFISGPEPGAVGALLPVLYTDLHLKYGFLFEVSLPLTAAIAWDDGRASRVGVGLMAAMNWGMPQIAPRLLTVGFLVHPPWPHPEDEVWSFFFGVNVASLLDLAGGR